jgi:hypothetical protein
MTTIGGADGCPGGWICVERDTITGEIFAEVLPTTRELFSGLASLPVRSRTVGSAGVLP